MKIFTTGDWHIGNIFHGNDRLDEHKHFFNWLLDRIKEYQPDALLVAGDVFDNGNPSNVAQAAYYNFLAQAHSLAPEMHIIITAGNHDSPSRLESPRELLTIMNMQIRGNVKRNWIINENNTSKKIINYDDLIIPICNQNNEEVIILAVPYLRNDSVQGSNYSEGVNNFLRELTNHARQLHPDKPIIMMAHMYAKGADIATKDASEKIIIGGLEEVDMSNWENHPDYLTCGHIHKRQHIWGTEWARYTGSVLPMSFAEKDYSHGIDCITINDNNSISIEKLTYTPQHRLRILPENEEVLTFAKLKRLINTELGVRNEATFHDTFDYLTLKIHTDKVTNDNIKELENLIQTKNAVLCKIQRINPNIDITTIIGNTQITSVDDILNRNPIETLKEAYLIKHKVEMNEEQTQMLNDLIENINLA